MEKERKGCLIMIIAIIVTAICIYIGLKQEWLFLKNIGFMSSGLMGSYVGDNYLNKESRTPKSHWKWYILFALIFTGIFLAGYALIWLIIFTVTKARTKKLNALLKSDA